MLKSLYTTKDVVYLDSIRLNWESLLDSTYVEGFCCPHCSTLSWGNPCCNHLCRFRIPFIQGCCSFKPVVDPLLDQPWWTSCSSSSMLDSLPVSMMPSRWHSSISLLYSPMSQRMLWHPRCHVSLGCFLAVVANVLHLDLANVANH